MYKKRLETIRDKLIKHRLDAILITNSYNLTYLTGFTGLSPEEREGYLLITKNAAIPHHDIRLSNSRVKRGSLILIDFGIKYKEYVSDITRVFFAGKPNPEIEDAYNILLHAQEKTIEKLSKDKDAKSLDSYCRRLLIENNQIDFSHSTGHGVGLEIHESPRLSSRSQDKLVDGNVFTVEPGIYVEGRWGMRIEDTVVLQNGKPKILTKFSKRIEEMILE